MSRLSAEQIESLTAAALAAPSADNRHMFRLEADADGLRLLATEGLLRVPRTRRVLALMSLGAAAENLGLRARSLGIQLDPHWLLDQGDGVQLAQFTWQPAPAIDNPLDGAIALRHTNRRLHFRGPHLPRATQENLSSEAAAIDGTRLVWLDEPPLRHRALQLVRWAETERFRNKDLHRELFESIRFDVGWRASTHEGLPPGSLELNLFERPFFSALRHWPIQRAANLLGAHLMIGMRAGDLPCRLAPHLCAIAATGSLETAAISAGRLLQRVWLRATTLGLAFQVFAASAVYALDDSTSIAPDLRRRLASIWSELCPSGRPYILVRMGYSRPPTVRAERPPLSIHGGVNVEDPSGWT